MDVDMENKNRTFPMDVSSAGADKLRLTVKDKLKEFMDSYTDDVLAEYVVVLVGHGKQKRQASADLEAFLGDQSEAFVTWLWDHLSVYKDVYVSATQSTNIRDKDVNEGESRCSNQQAKVASGRLEQAEAVRSDVEEFPRLPQKESRRPKKDLANHVSSSGRNQASHSHGGGGHGKHENGRKQHAYDGHGEAKRCKSPDSWGQRTRDRRARDCSPEKMTHRKESSRYHVRAPRRLLESAVREAVAPAVSILRRESTRKRLRSVVSAEEEHSGVLAEPNESRHALRSQIVLSKQDANAFPALSIALNAAAAAAEDVNSFKQSRPRSMNSVWDRLGKTSNKSEPLRDEVMRGVFAKEELLQNFKQGRLDEKSFYVEEDLVDEEIEDPFFDLTDGVKIFTRTSNEEQVVTLDENFAPADITPMILEAVRNKPLKECSATNIYHGEKLVSDSIRNDIKDVKLSSGSEIDKVVHVLNFDTHGFPLDESQQRGYGRRLSAEPRILLCSVNSEAEDRHEKGREIPVETSSSQKAVDNIPLKSPTDSEIDGLYPCSNCGVQKDGVVSKAQSEESIRELDVNEMKRRMRQVELEMTKLRARQAEVSKDVQEATTPISGVKPPGPSQSSEVNIDGRSIFVTNVHFSATKDAISAHFASCGDISRVTVLTDGTTGKPKGSAIVEFTSKEGVEKALNLNESIFFSRPLKVARKDSSCLESSSVIRPTSIHPSQAPLQTVGRGSIIRRPPLSLRWPLRPFRPFPATHHLQWKRESSLPGAINSSQAANHPDSSFIRPVGPTSPTPSLNAFRYGVSPVRLKRSLSYVRNVQGSTPSEASNDVQEQKVG